MVTSARGYLIELAAQLNENSKDKEGIFITSDLALEISETLNLIALQMDGISVPGDLH